MMKKSTKFGVLFNSISFIVLLIFLYNSTFDHDLSLKIEFNVDNFHQIGLKNDTSNINLLSHKICAQVFEPKGYSSSCEYVVAHPQCTSGGFMNYIKFFYCDCKKFTFLGYFILASWLAILFYLLGNTAADYFCCSLENLSELLNMSPSVAGVTLLPFGNGSPDVFASIAAFMGRSSGEVGFNSVLGGAVFVTCVVVGVVSLNVCDKRVQIDKECFVRDLCFFLFSIVCLVLMLVIGEVSIWGAMAFVSIYVVYAFFVAIVEILRKRRLKSEGLPPLIPVEGSLVLSCGGGGGSGGEDESMYASLVSVENPDNEVNSKLPHWLWNINVAIYSDYGNKLAIEGSRRPRGWNDDGVINEDPLCTFSKLCSFLEIPLSIPRRLTIPIVEENRWSKIYAIASALLAPVLLAVIWNTQENLDPLSGRIACFIGFSTGFVFSVLAFLYTTPDHPPRSFLFPWVFGGFFMSIIWFYIVANELVALLVSLGVIFGVNPALLALTILAMGNSMGDLMSNTALAMNDTKGVQIAMSGCYAGPMFNTLVGLGLSLVLGAWSNGSQPYKITQDSAMFITLGFLAVALLWALIVLPRNNMHPNKVLGVGLLVIYAIFLCLQISLAVIWSSPLV